VQIFDRKFRKAKLTQSGERLLHAAGDLLEASRKLDSLMSDTSRIHGVLRLGASELVGLTWLPKLVERVHAVQPSVVIHLDIEAGGQVLEKLKKGLIDLALVPGPMWGREFDSVSLASVEFAWMASPLLKAPRRIMTPEEMSAFPMLVHSPQGVATQLYNLWQQQSGFTIHKTLTANTLSVMAQLTIGGLGVSCLPTGYFRSQLLEGKLVKLRTSPALPRLDFFAVFRREVNHPLVKYVVDISKTVCDFRNPSNY